MTQDIDTVKPTVFTVNCQTFVEQQYHACVLIYFPQENRCEFFDPTGKQKMLEWRTHIFNTVCRIMKAKLDADTIDISEPMHVYTSI